jgi:hypothetical protein
MDGPGCFPGHLSHCRQRLFGCDQTRSKRTSEGLQGGLVWNATALGHPFRPVGRLHRRRVWSNFDKAKAAATTEVSALRTVVVLAGVFPEEQSSRIYALIKRHIDKSWNKEWPETAQQRPNFSTLPTDLIEALHDTLALKPADDSQLAAQSEMAIALYTALDARRQRIVISESPVGTAKWVAILLQGLCTLVAIAMVHSDNRLACAIAMILFATSIALSLLLVAAYSRPFL